MCLCINKTICVQATPSSFIHTAQLIDVMGRLTNHLTNEKTGKKGACWAPEVPYAQGGGQREGKIVLPSTRWSLACRSRLLCCLPEFGDDEENDEESLISLFTSNRLTLFSLFLHITFHRFFTLCFSCWGFSVFDARARQRCHFSTPFSKDRPPLKPIWNRKQIVGISDTNKNQRLHSP